MDREAPIETYLNALREINQQLQQDDIRMDDALKLYERGAHIARDAYERLDSYKQKIDSIETGLPAGGAQ